MNIPMTPERLAAIHEAVAAGWRREDIKKNLHVSDRALAKLGIRTNGRSILRPGDGRRADPISPEQVEAVRTLTAQGVTEQEIRKRLGISNRQLYRTKSEHNIKSLPMSERPKADKPVKVVKKKKRNPMNVLASWKPPVANTDLERVVQRLRAKYSPVCAEDTIRHPSRIPMGYRADTLFRVGNRQNVTAAELVTL